MNLRKSLLLISIILCIFISLAAVSANENTVDLTYADSNSIDDLSLNPVSEDVQEEVSSLGSDLSDEVPEEISSVPVSSEDLSADENSVGNDGILEENNEENIIQVEIMKMRTHLKLQIQMGMMRVLILFNIMMIMVIIMNQLMSAPAYQLALSQYIKTSLIL